MTRKSVGPARRGTRARAALVAVLALAMSGCWWTHAGYGPGRTSYNPVERRLTTESVAGLVPGGGVTPFESGRAVLADGLVAVLDSGGSMRAYAAGTGAERWNRPVNYHHDRAFDPGLPTVREGVVHLPLGATATPCEGCPPEADGLVLTLDLATGQEVTGVTPFPAGRAYEGSPILSGPFAVARWREPASDPGAPPARHTSVRRQSDGKQFDVGGSLTDVALDAAGARLFGVSAGADGSPSTVWAADLACARPPCPPRWTAEVTGAVVGTPVTDGATVAVVTDQGDLAVLDAATGLRRWSADVGVGSTQPPALAEGRVFVGRYGLLSVFEDCGSATCLPSWESASPAWPGGGVVVAGDVAYTLDVAWAPHERPTALTAYAAAGCGQPVCAPLFTSDRVDRPTDVAPIVANGLVVLPDGRTYRLPA
jgi:outer membrane protein assembly factor BamB